jgi:hypothetical protein
MTKKLFNLIIALMLSLALADGVVAQGGKPPEKPKEKEKIKERPKPTPTPKRPN